MIVVAGCSEKYFRVNDDDDLRSEVLNGDCEVEMNAQHSRCH